MAEQSTRALQSSWVDRIFDRMQGLYGSLWVDRWRSGETVTIAGRQMDAGLLNAKAVWAEELAGFAGRPDCIKSALDGCKGRSLPPTLPEFAQACRDAMRRIGDATQKLTHTMTEEERENAKKVADQIAGAAKRAEASQDFMKWATHPGSKIALAAVHTEAQSGNKVLRRVFDRLVADGIATPEGKALKLWAGGQWVKA